MEVAEIAISTAASTRSVIGAEPKAALLSFSTKGSAKHPFAEKMIEALRILRERAPQIDVDGELQGDAALIPAIAAVKAPGSAIGRQGSAPEGGPTTLTDSSLYDGSKARPIKLPNAPEPA